MRCTFRFSSYSSVILILLTTFAFSQNHQMNMNSGNNSVDSSLVRKGTINLVSLDVNKDGKLFHCPMEPNVLSDSHGDCPLCGMSLREIKIEDVKAKLLKRNFIVAESELQSQLTTQPTAEKTAVKIWNKVCPVMGEDVDPEAPIVDYQGKKIGFCCPGCEKKFTKDPEKYMKNLSEDGTKFLGK